MAVEAHGPLRLRDGQAAFDRLLGSGTPPRFLAIADPAPLRDLHAAGGLGPLAESGMTVVVVDAAVEAGTGRFGPDAVDREIRAFVEASSPPFLVAATDVWADERGRRRCGGGMPRANAVALAEADFLSSEDGLKALLATGRDVWLLCPERGVVAVNPVANLRLVTVPGLLSTLAAPRARPQCGG